MRELLSKLKRELRQIVNPVIFLFCMFEIVALTNWLLLESYSITPTHTFFAVIGALLGGKAIFVANQLPFLRIVQGKPVLLSVLWRSFVYALFCALFLAMEHVASGLLRHEEPLRSLGLLTSRLSLAHIAANAIWLFIALMLYNSYVEIDRHLGVGTLRRIFLTPAKGERAR
ncbi:MAG: hypothetical protein RL518_1099 [Pseudomonadota bacterium]|jgi:hypothetical protein